MSAKPPVEPPVTKPKLKLPGLPSNRTAMMWLSLLLLVWLAANVINASPTSRTPGANITPIATVRAITPSTPVATRAITPTPPRVTTTPTRPPTK